MDPPGLLRVISNGRKRKTNKSKQGRAKDNVRQRATKEVAAGAEKPILQHGGMWVPAELGLRKHSGKGRRRREGREGKEEKGSSTLIHMQVMLPPCLYGCQLLPADTCSS